ncbi:NBS-LRR resistance protein [Dorcoceras hygrometricum]|uniref:NBS-LRR resistance protein n=1 Tax=Dorcoceras hygrometricum TaxID=472368 RepID=A0A2Z7AAC6_9LAMI|nr:NBS-LRR resistance protein [Dorcoceras hygrometricum]
MKKISWSANCLMTSAVTSSSADEDSAETDEAKRKRRCDTGDPQKTMRRRTGDQQKKRSAKMKLRRMKKHLATVHHQGATVQSADAIGIQKEDVAMEIISRREESAGSNSTSSRCEIQSLEEKKQAKSKAVDNLRRVARAGCQLLSSIQNDESDRSLQKKRTQVLLLFRGALHNYGKKTRQPSGALKSFWKLSNGKYFYRGYILEATPIEEVVVRPVERRRWCYYILW